MLLGARERRSSKVDAGENQAARFNADAGIMADYERAGNSGVPFDYSRSILSAPQSVPPQQISAYLSRIQRGGMIQPFGCVIAVDGPSFTIIAFSENCFEMMGLDSRSPNDLIGIDARTLFSSPSAISLTKAARAREITLVNPIWVYSRVAQKSFYAIMHRVDVGIVIDLEPARSGDPSVSLAGAVQSQKLAVRAISRLQSVAGGNIAVLCDTVVEDVQKLTGYDRVMVYKFHDDDHGEVLSEIRRADLEPYLGLHYPATDIPQAARFLFKQNRIRIICDCNASSVRVIQSEKMKQPLCLVNSTLRSPHGCHAQYMANMGSIASLVMAVVLNTNESARLWGLVVCHHTSPRYVPYTLRYACEFLMQAFGLQVYMELQLAAQLAEKRVIHTQTLLCDMLLRDAPLGIVTKSPSIKDLVKCDGAALYYAGKCWLLGVTPIESQVKDIADWLLSHHGDSTGMSTDSLADAGYPGASQLGDAVCGLASAKITSKDFLFWFRSHTAVEVKWGGAKHHPRDRDDGGRMHPRSSFKAFLEVVKSRSIPWEPREMDAIHSLQLIVRESFQEIRDNDSKSVGLARMSADTDMKDVDELSSVACEMVKLIETATVPIFGVDSGGFINGWNEKIAELTGLESSKAMGKSLVNDILREDTCEAIENLVARALQGKEEKNIALQVRNFGASTPSDIYIVANSCTSRDHTKSVVGVCFVGQDVTGEKVVMDKFIRLQGDYKAIIQSLNPLIPPIFASDENACCSEWNAAMEKLTGFKKDQVLGKFLPGEVFGGLCKLKGQDSLTKFMITLYKGISGQDIEKQPLEFYDREGNVVEVLLTANRRTDLRGKVIGCFCFVQILVPEIQQALEACAKDEPEGFSKLRELAYIRQEMKNPMNGIRFTHELLESTGVSENQKQFLNASEACERQIRLIIEDDLGSIEEGKLELNMEEFRLGNVLDAIVSQVMILLREKNLQLYHEVPEEIKSVYLYGDHIRLQLVLSDFLINVVHHSPMTDGWVKIEICPGQKSMRDGNEFIHIQFRMSHPGEGIPAPMIQDMFDNEKHWTTQEGLGLNLSRKLLSRLNGQVKYVRERDKCFFLVDIEFQTAKKESGQVGSSSRADSSRMT